MTLANADEPAARRDHGTAPTGIAEQLKAEIALRRLPAGTLLSERLVVERFSVSRPTAREALRILESDNFVRREPHKSAVVRAVSQQEALDLLDLRIMIDSKAAHRAPFASPTARQDVEDSLARYAEAAQAGDYWAESRAHTDLHLRIAALSGNARLVAILEELLTESLLSLAVVDLKLQDSEKMIRVHTHLVRNLLDGSLNEALAAVREHYGMVRHAVADDLSPSQDSAEIAARGFDEEQAADPETRMSRLWLKQLETENAHLRASLTDALERLERIAGIAVTRHQPSGSATTNSMDGHDGQPSTHPAETSSSPP